MAWGDPHLHRILLVVPGSIGLLLLCHSWSAPAIHHTAVISDVHVTQPYSVSTSHLPHHQPSLSQGHPQRFNTRQTPRSDNIPLRQPLPYSSAFASSVSAFLGVLFGGWLFGFYLVHRRHAKSVAIAPITGTLFSLVPDASYQRLAPLQGRRAASIARTKGRTDQRKADLYSRYGKKIISAVKAGGADEKSNVQLRDLILEAKAANVPMSNITNAIAKGAQQDTADFKEIIYECYGKGGVGMIITALTDNANRAFEKVGSCVNWCGLTMAKPGSVTFKFERKSAIFLDSEIDEDKLIEVALEAGVDDAELDETDDGDVIVWTAPKDCMALKEALVANNVKCSETRLMFQPLSREACSEEDEAANRLAIERLQALDDVDWVDHNMG